MRELYQNHFLAPAATRGLDEDDNIGTYITWQMHSFSGSFHEFDFLSSNFCLLKSPIFTFPRKLYANS